VKITGATSDSLTEDIDQQQLPTLPVLDSFVKSKEMGEVGSIESTSTPTEKLVDVACMNEAKDQDETEDGLFAHELSSAFGLSDEDVDFLDVLVDTLDGEFDPNLLL